MWHIRLLQFFEKSVLEEFTAIERSEVAIPSFCTFELHFQNPKTMNFIKRKII